MLAERGVALASCRGRGRTEAPLPRKLALGGPDTHARNQGGQLVEDRGRRHAEEAGTREMDRAGATSGAAEELQRTRKTSPEFHSQHYRGSLDEGLSPLKTAFSA